MFGAVRYQEWQLEGDWQKVAGRVKRPLGYVGLSLSFQWAGALHFAIHVPPLRYTYTSDGRRPEIR